MVFHAAAEVAWPSIQAYGLLSTERLLDLHRVAHDEQVRLLTQPRASNVELSGSGLPRAVIRDQKPMKFLAEKIESGQTMEDFLMAINTRVFFWPTRERLERLRAAKEYRGQDQVILHIDTRRLVQRYEDQIQLCRFNSGAITQKNHPARSRRSWLSIRRYPYAEYRRKHGKSGALAEVTVLDAVPDVLDLIVEVEHRSASRLIEAPAASANVACRTEARPRTSVRP